MYMESVERSGPGVEMAPLDEPERVFEFMLNALRLTDGFDQSMFVERTGLPATRLNERLAVASEKQLIEEVSGGFWRVTGLGQRFLNDLQGEFLP